MIEMTAATDHERRAVGGVGLLLARLWGREIDRPLVNDFSGPLRAASQSIPALGRIVAASTGQEDCFNSVLEELSVDWCRIMVGPGRHAAPVQSVWEHGSLASAATDSLKQTYLEVVWGYEPPVPRIVDHFANEVQIMSIILVAGPTDPSAADDRIASAADDRIARLELARNFYREHLQWARPMVRRAAALATSDVYAETMDLTLHWLSEVSTIAAPDRHV